jgi:hypothetical protein
MYIRGTTFLLAAALVFVGACVSLAGAPQNEVTLNGVNGKPRKVLAAKEKRPVTFLFLGHDCPISNKYSPEINRIVAQYGSRIAFYIVYADPHVAISAARQHSQDFGYRCPAVLDPKHLLVKRAGATVTPEAAVFDSRGGLAYRGRIDDTYIDFGKRRDAPTRRDLRQALDSVLKGKKIEQSRTKAVGCFIPGRA